MNSNFFKHQKTTILSCLLAVSILVFLFLGDFIILHFLPVSPNQTLPLEEDVRDEVLDEEVPSISVDPLYDTSFMKNESLDSILARIKRGETVFLFSGRSTCSPCRKFLPILREAYDEKPVESLFYLDRSFIDEYTEGYYEFLNLSDTLQENFSSTPFFYGI